MALKNLRRGVAKETDTEWLITQSEIALKRGEFQATALFAERAEKAIAILGYAEFMCGNYAACEAANRRAPALNPNDTYALKDLGLALHKQGDFTRGIEYVERAAELTGYADEDILRDLEYVRKTR